MAKVENPDKNIKNNPINYSERTIKQFDGDKFTHNARFANKLQPKRRCKKVADKKEIEKNLKELGF